VSAGGFVFIGASEVSRGVKRASDAVVQQWTQIVRGEYLEIPGLRLTRTQVRSLWGLDDDLCDRILDALIDARFLQRTRADGFVRMDGVCR